MNKVIKYLAIVFAIALSVGIIGGCLAALVAVVQGITEETGQIESADTNGLIYQEEDGGMVVFGIKIGGTENTVSFTKTFEEEEIQSISLESAYGDMIVKLGDKFEVVAENVPESYKVEVKDGVLTARRTSHSFHLFSWFSGRKTQKVTVTVPETFAAEQFRLDNGSGSMEVTGIRADKLSLDSGSGYVILREVTANRTDIDKGSGKVEVLDSELGNTKVDNGSGTIDFSGAVTRNLVVNSGSGRVSYEGTMTGNCIFDTGSGSVSLVLDASEQDYNITADMGSGSFYLNGKSMKNANIRHDQAENTILFDCGSGRVSVEFTKE